MMENCKEVVDIIYEFEELIHTKKNGIVWVAYHYGKIFERFKKREKLMGLVEKFGISKLTIVFKMKLAKLIDSSKNKEYVLVTKLYKRLKIM